MSTKDERISNQSMDLGEFNKERLLEMFPVFRTEGGGVDFDRLKLTLGESVEVGKEVFGMRWPGKADSIRLANTPSHGTLSPDEEESVNFDTTQNLIIEGDNLEVLKLLQKSYQGKVKMIYIDPPYNTGNDFVYEDDFADGIKNYLQQTGQIDGEGNRLSTNSETDGRFHSNWMNMMHPRLSLARNLLSDDGAICMSIDDNEFANLLELGNEIFGESNQVGVFCVTKAEGGGLAKHVIKGHDYLVVYAKSIGDFKPLMRPKDIRGRTVELEGEEYWIEEDWLRKEFGKYGTCHYEEIEKYLGKDKLIEIDKGLKSGIYVLLPKGTTNIVGRYRKISEDGSKFYSILKHLNKNGVRDLADLGGMDSFFDYPKPVSLIEEIALGATMFTKNDNNLVLDFFGGSGTTAHAVMSLNAKDGGNRKFILVQLPELVDPESEAAKAGFGSIADITKERVRRAGKKIIEESDGKLNLNGEDALDFGFRVLKLNESNIEDWNSEEASKSPKDLFDALKTTRLKSGRSEKDVVFEVLVKFGIELTSKVEEKKVGKGSVWKIGGGELLIVVSAGLTVPDLNSIAKMAPKVVVMLDEAFVPESLKTNARAVFKDAKIELKTF
jgi:adenine-specific DNA-methyltransferase